MTIEEYLHNVSKAILARKRLIITSLILIIVGVVLVRLYNEFYFVNISVSKLSNTDTSSQIIYSHSGNKSEDIGKPGLKLLHKDVKSISVNLDGRIETLVPIEAPWYRFVDKKVTLQHDKNAEKVAYRNSDAWPCSTYSPRLKSLLSYNCRTPLTLSHMTSPKDSSVVATFKFINDIATPYNGGVIGVMQATEQHVNGAIVAVSDSGKVTSYSPPKELNRNTVGSAKIYTDTINPDDTRFVIVDREGSIYLGSPTENGGVSYVRYAAPKEYVSSQMQTKCNVINEEVYCYRGRFAIGDAPAEPVPITQTITRLSFSNNKATVSKIEDDSKNILNSFQVTTGGEMYGQYYKRLVRYMIEGDTVKVHEIAQNVDAISTNNTLYYIQQSGVFALEDKKDQAHQVFYSDNISPESLYGVENNIFMVGSIIGSGTVSHAYLLNNEDNLTPSKRIIDLLPTSFRGLPKVSDQNLVGNKYHVSLAVTINKKARSAVEAVDNGELDQAKELVKDAILARGVNLEDIELTFSY